MKRLRSDEAGFTFVEVIAAAFVLALGITGTVSAFTSSQRANLASQRREVAIHMAQQRLELLRNTPYSELKMESIDTSTSVPPDHPLESDGHFTPSTSGPAECLVLTESGPAPTDTTCPGGAGGAVKPSEPFSVDSAVGSVTGTINQYVTWRGEGCPPAKCRTNELPKRITVAVFLTPVGSRTGIGPTAAAPVWMSTVKIDPNASAADQNPSPIIRSNDVSRSLYLYSAPCGNDTYPGPATSPTATRSTAEWNATGTGTVSGATSGTRSHCGSSLAVNRPDLMGPIAPEGGPAAIPNYSRDLAKPGGIHPTDGWTLSSQGLWLGEPGPGMASCSFNNGSSPNLGNRLGRYTSAQDGAFSLNQPGRWTSHSWVTAPVSGADLRLRKDMSLELYASGLRGEGGTTPTFCVSVFRRKVTTEIPDTRWSITDEVLTDPTQGATCPAGGPLPTSPAEISSSGPLSCSFQLASGREVIEPDGRSVWIIPGDGTYRLVITLRVFNTGPSHYGANLFYDNGSYPSRLNVWCEDSCPF